MVISDPDRRAKEMGFMDNNTIVVCNGIVLASDTMDKLIESLKLRSAETGLPYKATVKRGAENLDIEAKTVLLGFNDIFRPMDQKPDKAMIQTFKKWSKN